MTDLGWWVVRSADGLLLDLDVLLQSWLDGNECGWAEEFTWLEQNHADKLETLMADIERDGIQQPIILGNDGRVWDGHHRIYCAHILGIRKIPIELVSKGAYAGVAPDGCVIIAADWGRDDD